MASQSASKRSTSSVMLSSTRKIAPAPCAPRVGDVGEHALDRIRMKVAAAHLDDRAEAAVERAAARGFDDVDRPAEQRVAVSTRASRFGSRSGSDASGITGRAGMWRTRPSAVRNDSPAMPAKRSRPFFERAQQLAERLLAFAADDEVDASHAS